MANYTITSSSTSFIPIYYLTYELFGKTIIEPFQLQNQKLIRVNPIPKRKRIYTPKLKCENGKIYEYYKGEKVAQVYFGNI